MKKLLCAFIAMLILNTFSFAQDAKTPAAGAKQEKKAEAKTKDKWENYLTSEVKAGKMTLGQAQSEIQQTHTSSPPKQ